MAENSDLTNAFEQLQQMLSDDEGQSQIQNILNMFTSSQESAQPQSDTTPPQNQSEGIPGLDFDTIMKISSIMQAFNNNADNPKTTFLNALRPFLTKNRQQKLDNATKLIKMSSVLKVFRENNNGGV